MRIIGLTGSIGMGKSTVASMFRARGINVFDADAEVHRLYAGAAVPLIEKAFPGTTRVGVVDRSLLSNKLGGSPDNFAKLESIVHPLVQSAERAFILREAERGASLAVLEIPLLFEAGLAEKVDSVVVVSAPAYQQRDRVLARDGMTEDRLNALLARQLSDGEKRARADFIVDTGTSIEETEAQIDTVLAKLPNSPLSALQSHWQ